MGEDLTKLKKNIEAIRKVVTGVKGKPSTEEKPPPKK